MNLESIIKNVEDHFGLKVIVAKENTGRFGLHEKKALINFPSGRLFTQVDFCSVDGYNWCLEVGGLLQLFYMNMDCFHLLDNKLLAEYHSQFCERWLNSPECEAFSKSRNLSKEFLSAIANKEWINNVSRRYNLAP